jgi:hypothetical protein
VEPRNQPSSPVFWVLLTGVVMEFAGHGALGVMGMASWVSYFGVVGLHRDTAVALMPLVGFFDVAMAMAALLYPMRALVCYMGFWGLWTALLRPLAGESAWEAFERAGNFGALYAFFLLARGGGWKSWLRFDVVADLDGRLRLKVCWVLRLTTALLLLGHGALGLFIRKPLFATHYAAVGLHGAWVEPLLGGFECVLACAVLLKPGAGLLAFVVAWKVATEALSPIAGSSIWVFVEHGGSYAAPLALAFLSGREAAVPVFLGRPQTHDGTSSCDSECPARAGLEADLTKASSGATVRG